jgi:hypothetical protein
MDAENAERVAAALGAVNWERLPAIAAAHGVASLLFTHLSAIEPSAIPPDVLLALRRKSEQNLRKNLLWTNGLGEILAALDASGVRALPYKGPVLAQLLDDHLAFRHFTDLDLFVGDGFAAARKVLGASGFIGGHGLAADQERTWLQSLEELALKHPGSGVIVDLHRRLSPRRFPFGLGFEDVWRRRQPVIVGGRSHPSLSAEDHLVVLCMHGSKHFWGRLDWIADVMELAHPSHELDWELVFDLAAAAGGRRMLLVGLALARDLLGAQLPELVDRALATEPAAALARKAEQQVLAFPVPARPALEWMRWYLALQDSGADRVRCFMRFAAGPSHGEVIRQRFPARLAFLHHVMRPVHLAAKIVRLRRPEPRVSPI